MRALVVTRPGGPDVLEVRDVPEPSPGRDEVLVRVRAAALNAPTSSSGKGGIRHPPAPPPTSPGSNSRGRSSCAAPTCRCGSPVIA